MSDGEGEGQVGGEGTGDAGAGGEGEGEGTGTGEGEGAGEGQGTVLTGDQQTGEGEGAGEGAGEGEGEGESQVPEAYEFTMPEGMELDQAMADAATPVFKELGLTQEQADKLVALQADAVQRQAEASQAAFDKQLNDWATELKNDSEFGGDAFDENAGIARTAIDKLGSEGLKDMLDSTGIGNHPELFKFCLKVGKLLSEDDPGSGDAGEGETSIAERMYPNDAKTGT